MSTLVTQAIAQAGLAAVAAARDAGDLAAVRAQEESLRTADLLVLGALADRVRAADVGDLVRVYTNAAPPLGSAGEPLVDVHAFAGPGVFGIHFLRAVAIARITSPRGARVQVDWSKVGIELAQVSLGFGASELVGPIATKRGLPIADDAAKKVKGQGMVSLQRLKQRELAQLVRRAGRRVVLVGPNGVEPEMSEAEAVAAEAAILEQNDA